MTSQFRRFKHHGDVDVADLESILRGHRHGLLKQVEAPRIFPPWIRVWKVKADVAKRGGAKNRVGHCVADDVGIRVPERAAL